MKKYYDKMRVDDPEKYAAILRRNSLAQSQNRARRNNWNKEYYEKMPREKREKIKASKKESYIRTNFIGKEEELLRSQIPNDPQKMIPFVKKQIRAAKRILNKKSKHGTI